MSAVRLGAVNYLNARPLVYGLERRQDLFSVRFDPPSLCATLLHGGEIDVGMIPSIEYNRGREEYRIVPGMAIISDGVVASVALFTKVPLERIRTSAGDRFGFEALEEDGSVHSVPYHRVRAVWRDGELIWSRQKLLG